MLPQRAPGREFDVIVLGAGPAGEVCAGRLGAAGLSVAIIERELVGGECSYYACMPSKALLRPAQALAEARRVAGAAQAVRGELDVPAVLARRDEIVHDRDDSVQLPWLSERGVELIRGTGRLAGERTVTVSPPGGPAGEGPEEILEARRAVIVAVGSAPVFPPIEGLAEAAPWTNRQATSAESIPDSLVILGGGPVGVEMAQAYRTLGARVSIVEGAPRLIPGEEPFAAELLQEAFQGAGIDVRTGIRARTVRREGPDAPVSVELEDGSLLTGSELLLATGRRPRTEDLGLESVGLEGGRAIEVDDTLRVRGRPWLYAIGDANGRVLLTHMGKYQGRLVADRILGRPRPLLSDGRLSPRVIFTEPQVAAVGHTHRSALDAGLNARAVDRDTGANAGSSFIGHGAPGRSRLVVDEDRGVIVGATITGADISEFLQAATLAVVGEVPLDRVWHAVPCFPTRSELWLGLLEELGL